MPTRNKWPSLCSLLCFRFYSASPNQRKTKQQRSPSRGRGDAARSLCPGAPSRGDSATPYSRGPHGARGAPASRPNAPAAPPGAPSGNGRHNLQHPSGWAGGVGGRGHWGAWVGEGKGVCHVFGGNLLVEFKGPLLFGPGLPGAFHFYVASFSWLS